MYKQTASAEHRFRASELKLFQQGGYTVSFDAHPEWDDHTFRLWMDNGFEPFKQFRTNEEAARYCRDVLNLKPTLPG